ncbi:MAG: hypothetical protein ABUS57_03375 [Pseudomonadota bacterium]
MKATLIIAASAAALMLWSCGVGGAKYPSFGGTAYRLEGVSSSLAEASQRTVIYRDGAKMRVETDLPVYGRAAVVFDQDNAAFVVDPARSDWAQHVATSTEPPPVNTSAGVSTTIAARPGAVVTPPPLSAGVAVRISDADAPQPMETFWAVLGQERVIDVGPCVIAGQRGEMWRPKANAASNHRVACITSDGIVLQLREDGRVLFEATRLDRGRQDAHLFGVPVGYRKLDPNHVAPPESVVATNAP